MIGGDLGVKDTAVRAGRPTSELVQLSRDTRPTLRGSSRQLSENVIPS